MKNTLINETCAAMTSNYYEAFWKAMRGNNLAFGEMAQARIIDNGGTYLFPAKVASRYSAALKNTNLFRQISTVMAAPAGDAMFWMGDMDEKPQWVPENAAIPAGNDTLGPKKHVNFHKLAVITSLELDYVSEAAFDLEGYLVGKFAKCFGKAEEDAFINGSGNSMPKGILHDTDGAETGVTVSGDISFDDVLGLYFSVDKRYRSNGVWLMNDETALKLKTLKDQNGQYLWNQNSDTILGKPVYISEFMPSDGKPVAFGDFSYYYIIDRVPLTVRPLIDQYLPICITNGELRDTPVYLPIVRNSLQATRHRWIITRSTSRRIPSGSLLPYIRTKAYPRPTPNTGADSTAWCRMLLMGRSTSSSPNLSAALPETRWTASLPSES